MKKILQLILAFLILFNTSSKADEGMWIPLLLKKYNIEEMRANGFKLTAEDIYSINKASMKDAVMIFGGGCTGELISDQGLVLTNHHCGYGAIQQHSSVENDYLTDGFWAMNRSEELNTPGLTVAFLVRMEDVTSQVLKDITAKMTEVERQNVIKLAIKAITEKATAGTHYTGTVKPFYFGNEYYLFVQETYTDIRMVGAPPSAIGKFGGDTDNWMWPRHTGDFSMFRIYAGKDNKPAAYSEDNVPFVPKKHFPIAMNGVDKGDFTMIFGYPGSTEQYLTSFGVKMISEAQNPQRIAVRQMKINKMNSYMNADKKVRIQYASKYARVSNYWKKWIGENRGLKRLGAIETKQKMEAGFTKWVTESTMEKKSIYSNMLSEYEGIYKELTPYALANDYFREAGYSLEMMQLASYIAPLMQLTDETKEEIVDATADKTKRRLEGFFKNYYQPIDREIFGEALKLYYDNVDKRFHPATFTLIETKFKGNFEAYADYVFAKTSFNKPDVMYALLDNYSIKANKKLMKDPAYILYKEMLDVYFDQIKPKNKELNNRLDRLNRTWVNALRAYEKDKVFYPDANFTLRVAYGQIEGSEPYDGMEYTHLTTLDGIMDKDNPDVYDYRVPARLKELHAAKDYGQYGEGDKMPVCFLASNHTTGGNSGSPVIDANGHLIGINFDRSWESTMSDIMYDPDQCRNIAVDIRYVLFIVDKFAGAGHLVEEMDLVFDKE